MSEKIEEISFIKDQPLPEIIQYGDILNVPISTTGKLLTDFLTINPGRDILLKHGGNIKFTSVVAPIACTATLIETETGNVNAGTHTYKVTYVNATGETELGAASNTITADATHKQVALSAIPASSSTSVTKRKIYRTKIGGSTYFLLTTINNNTGTTYTDNTADADLTGGVANNKENDTFGKIIIDGIESLSLGKLNIFIGQYAGVSNITGNRNSAMGNYALYSNTTGGNNSAIGYNALYSNTTGYFNSAVGVNALYFNTTGDSNSAVGYQTLYSNTTGYFNSAVGVNALYFNTTGDSNSAMGFDALSNLTGAYHDNTALGFNAGRYWANGSTELTTPSQSVYIGSDSKGFNNSDVNSIVIGYNAIGIGANSVVLGNDSITTTALKGSVGIGTTSPNANAILDITSITKAFMPPRMTTAQRDAVASPTAGMVIYNSTTNVLNFHNGTAWGAV